MAVSKESMSDGTSLTIKRPITVRAVVTPTWKEEAERELSSGIATADQQLAQLEQEGQDVVDQVRRQSANPLDPRVQDQVAQIQQQVAAKRAAQSEQRVPHGAKQAARKAKPGALTPNSSGDLVRRIANQKKHGYVLHKASAHKRTVT